MRQGLDKNEARSWQGRDEVKVEVEARRGRGRGEVEERTRTIER